MTEPLSVHDKIATTTNKMSLIGNNLLHAHQSLLYFDYPSLLQKKPKTIMSHLVGC